VVSVSKIKKRQATAQEIGYEKRPENIPL